MNDADDFDELNLMWQLTLFPLVIIYSISLSLVLRAIAFIVIETPTTITWLHMSIMRHLTVTVIEEFEEMTDGD